MIHMKQMFKKSISRISAGILTAVMTFTVIPNIVGTDKVMADTTKDQNNTGLGTAGIAGPSAPEASKAWEGSYVYFGTYKGTPIKFRVLDPMTTAYGGTTLFLDSDKVLYQSSFDTKEDIWENSEIRDFLNNEFYTGSFSAFEQAAIAKSKVKGGEAYSSDTFKQFYYHKTVGLSGDKVFLLDAADLLNESYGYSSDPGWKLKSGKWSDAFNTVLGNMTTYSVINHTKSQNDTCHWWLRSEALIGGFVGAVAAGNVDKDGSMKMLPKSQASGVAPAINVDLSKVLFSTAVDGEPGKAGTGYKLTIINDSLSVETGSVSVKGSTISCTPVGNGDRISVLVTDGEWNSSEASIIYLGVFDGSIDLSAVDIKGKDYHVYLIAEEINGDKETDYASKPVELSKPSVTVTFSANGHGTAPATQKVSYGNKITKPSDLTASGFTFGGWYKDSACTKTYDFNSEVTTDITLYAKWTAESKPTPSTPGPSTPTPSATGGGFEDFVERLYTVALNRASEPEGKAFWCEHVGNGDLNGAQCANEFLLSKEFNDRKLTDEQFLEVLYKTFFDREAKDDKDGFNFWMNCLKTQGRDSVVDCFINSEEWCNVCASFGVKSGATRAKATIASKNATDFATRLYTECLGRDPEEGGLKFWSLGLTNLELTGRQAAYEFFFSKEFNDFGLDNKGLLTRMYRTFMGREPDDDGMNFWLDNMKNGMNKEQVFEEFVKSPEFTQICKDYAIDRG